MATSRPRITITTMISIRVKPRLRLRELRFLVVIVSLVIGMDCFGPGSSTDAPARVSSHEITHIQYRQHDGQYDDQHHHAHHQQHHRLEQPHNRSEL